MYKKTLIIGLIFTSLIIFTTLSVNAIEETKTINDPVGDVIDFSGDVEKPGDYHNIDIKKIVYESEGKTVTLTCEVDGKIENKGDLDPEYDEEPDLTDLFTEMTSYMFILETSDEGYSVMYINKECSVTKDSDFSEAENIYSSSDGSILTISFDLNSDDETYQSLTAETSYMKLSFVNAIFYIDEVEDYNDIEYLEVSANGPSEGKINEAISFSGDTTGGIPPYQWNWDFGDGTTSTLQNPTHQYSQNDTYIVTLTVYDGNDDYDSYSFFIDIKDESNNNNNNNNDTNNSGDIKDKVDNDFFSTSVRHLLVFIALMSIVILIGVAIVVIIIRR